jgi:Concanavalin A-like lectin/glucanases superfamily
MRHQDSHSRARSKSQSAMEYLMTYGWSILIIAVVLGALFSMGVFNSANFSPRASAGNCKILRVAGTANLEGTCSGVLPQSVVVLNGAGSYMSVGSAASNLASQVTVSGWIYVTVLNVHNNYVFSNDRDSSGSYNGFALRVENNAGYFDIWDSSQNVHVVSGGTVNTNKWYFLTGTYDGSNLKVYVNGAFVANTFYSGTMGTPASFGSYLGAMGYSPANYALTGMLSDVQIYNTTLDASQIQLLYLKGIGAAPVDPVHTVGWWPLNGNANDYSGGNNNGAATGITYTSSWISGYTPP